MAVIQSFWPSSVNTLVSKETSWPSSSCWRKRELGCTPGGGSLREKKSQKSVPMKAARLLTPSSSLARSFACRILHDLSPARLDLLG